MPQFNKGASCRPRIDSAGGITRAEELTIALGMTPEKGRITRASA
jgi:hypothetical protein